jgi:hypothetical protein
MTARLAIRPFGRCRRLIESFGDFVELVARHDAESAYACRVADALRWMAAAKSA